MSLSFHSFENVFRFNPNFSYGTALLRQIVDDRKKMGGTLFFDRLLEFLSVKDCHQLYPPRTNSDIRQLHRNIIASSVEDHHKLSLLYYILCDCSGSSTTVSSFSTDHTARRSARGESVSTTRSRVSVSPSTSIATIAGHHHGFDYNETAAPSRAVAVGDQSHAEIFAATARIPTQYVICMRGLWDLDRFHITSGVEQLVYPSLTPIFFDEILTFLVSYVVNNCPLSSPDSRLSSSHKSAVAHLPLQYFNSSASRPQAFTTQSAYLRYLTLYVGSQAAYSYLKRSPPSEKHQFRALFEQIITDILSNPSLLPESSRMSDSIINTSMNASFQSQTPAPPLPYPIRSSRATEFINLHLTRIEESWFEEYLSTGGGSSLPNARDMLIMRRLVFGQSFGEVLPTGPLDGSSFYGNTRWGSYADLASLPPGVGRADTFQSLMKEAVEQEQ